jgi:uncharacterized protein YlzI (FlbEa/FlbD family)
MKFITLTKYGGASILINPMMVQAIEPSPSSQAKSIVHMMAGTSLMIMETIEEIQKRIKESENIHTITWETGPR